MRTEAGSAPFPYRHEEHRITIPGWQALPREQINEHVKAWLKTQGADKVGDLFKSSSDSEMHLASLDFEILPESIRSTDRLRVRGGHAQGRQAGPSRTSAWSSRSAWATTVLRVSRPRRSCAPVSTSCATWCGSTTTT